MRKKPINFSMEMNESIENYIDECISAQVEKQLKLKINDYLAEIKDIRKATSYIEDKIKYLCHDFDKIVINAKNDINNQIIANEQIYSKIMENMNDKQMRIKIGEFNSLKNKILSLI